MYNLIMVPNPYPTLETERLTLRRILPDDAGELLNLYSSSEVVKYIELSPLATPEQALDLIAKI